MSLLKYKDYGPLVQHQWKAAESVIVWLEVRDHISRTGIVNDMEI